MVSYFQLTLKESLNILKVILKELAHPTKFGKMKKGRAIFEFLKALDYQIRIMAPGEKIVDFDQAQLPTAMHTRGDIVCFR